ncbi:hypothetical protein JKY72_01805 [Candidatus Gracilibacteria bacterium]|nr:hypothetical protein [Candidatus Gracilibacteria bacterium]
MELARTMRMEGYHAPNESFTSRPEMLARYFDLLEEESSYRQILRIKTFSTNQLRNLIDELGDEAVIGEELDVEEKFDASTFNLSLTSAEEVSLLQAHKEGRDSDDPELVNKRKHALEELCKSYTPLILAMSKHLAPIEDDVDDLFQMGMEIFIDSLDKLETEEFGIKRATSFILLVLYRGMTNLIDDQHYQGPFRLTSHAREIIAKVVDGNFVEIASDFPGMLCKRDGAPRVAHNEEELESSAHILWANAMRKRANVDEYALDEADLFLNNRGLGDVDFEVRIRGFNRALLELFEDPDRDPLMDNALSVLLCFLVFLVGKKVYPLEK